MAGQCCGLRRTCSAPGVPACRTAIEMDRELMVPATDRPAVDFSTNMAFSEIVAVALQRSGRWSMLCTC